MPDNLLSFLGLVRDNSYQFDDVPKARANDLRRALSNNLVRVGFGGLIELTQSGRDELAISTRFNN